jgi:deoxyribodipyrimidine photo-lyase
MGYNQARLRRLNAAAMRAGGDYVLYWMQAYRRFERNHALEYAARCAGELGKPLVVYEGLRLDYPWASARLHGFVLEGMAGNVKEAVRLGLHYWPFVETPRTPAQGLLTRLSARAALVVTDDFPCFIVPGQSQALAQRVEVPAFAVDSNGLVPLSLLGAPVATAAHLRPRLHKAFAEAWAHRTPQTLSLPRAATKPLDAPFELWRPPSDLDAFLQSLPIDASVRPVASTPGGRASARAQLAGFVTQRLRGYAGHRSEPASPTDGHASGLSPYLHFGHIGIEEVAEAVLGPEYSADELRVHNGGKREGYFGDDADVNGFLDEALTWRDVGFHWHWTRRKDADSLGAALPPWAFATLQKHASDTRAFVYTPEQWEAAATHDPLWNAAQRELVTTGTLHNYLRMLWGKKVLEWSRTPEEAYSTLVHLNNKYALDGRDPNSWSGILWCFGLFDRPWAPERNALGVLRYMSSANTARKFRLGRYFDYVNGLPALESAP